jgi:hypothetical protein
MPFVRAGYLLALRQFWPDIYALSLTALVRALPASLALHLRPPKAPLDAIEKRGSHYRWNFIEQLLP